MILGTLFIFLAVIMPTIASKNLFSLKWKPFAFTSFLSIQSIPSSSWTCPLSMGWRSHSGLNYFCFFTDFRSYCLKLRQHVALIDLLFKHLWELSDTVSKINYRNELYFNCYHHLLWTKEADSQLPFFLDSQSKYIEW